MAISAVNAVGVLGGTFDPIHNGHLRLAWEALVQLKLKEVRLIPCHLPPHRATPASSAQHRLAMTHLACRDVPGFVVDDWEIRREAPSWSVDTLSYLRTGLGQSTGLVFLMGMDAFCQFCRWHQWPQILELAHLWVAQRPGSQEPATGTAEHALLAQRQTTTADLLAAPAGNICLYPSTALDISATDLRNRMAQGISPRFLLPDAVCSYIEQHQLYHPRTAHPAHD